MTMTGVSDEAERLRVSGWTTAAIAIKLRGMFPINPRVAMRVAHGFSPDQVADIWNNLWPDGARITPRQVTLWETWPDVGGRAPSQQTLNRLALVYRCGVSDLVGPGGSERA